jgi:hypothetical protein
MKTLFLNSFEKYSEKTLILFGLLFSLLGGFLGFIFNARYDGVIDLHFVEKVPSYQPFLEIFLAVFCLAFFLFLVGKKVNPKTRFIDLLATCMIAKIPFYFMTVFNYNSMMYNISTKMIAAIKNGKINDLAVSDLNTLLLSAIISILLVVWSIALLFNGFKIATNAKETKHTLFFIAAIIFAEIISKIALYKLS